MKLLLTAPVAWIDGTNVAPGRVALHLGLPVPLKPKLARVTLLPSVQAAAICAIRASLVLVEVGRMPHCSIRPLQTRGSLCEARYLTNRTLLRTPSKATCSNQILCWSGHARVMRTCVTKNPPRNHLQNICRASTNTLCTADAL